MEQAQGTGGGERLTRPTHGLLFWQLGQAANSRFRRALQPLGLQTQPFVVLKGLAARGPSSQSELSQTVGVDPSNLASITAQLERDGLLERRRDQANRRRYVITVTPAGTDLLVRAQEAVDAADADMLHNLTPVERDELYATLVRILDDQPSV